MSVSIDERIEDRCYIDKPDYCSPTSRNSEGDNFGLSNSTAELFEEENEKTGNNWSNVSNSTLPSQYQQNQDKGDFNEVSLPEQASDTETVQGLSGRKRANRIFPADFGLRDGDVEGCPPNSKLKYSLYTKIKDALYSLGKTIKNSLSYVFTSESPFGTEVQLQSFSDYGSNSYDGGDDYTESDCSSAEVRKQVKTHEVVTVHDCHPPDLPKDEADTETLVYEWVVDNYKQSEVQYNDTQQCQSPKASENVSTRKKLEQPEVINMDMTKYIHKRKFGDLEIRVGKNAYKVDSCFLQAQSKKFRQIIFWGGLDQCIVHKIDDRIQYIRLNDMNAVEFEALLMYMYNGHLLPSALSRNGNEPSQRFLQLLNIYGIPYGSSEN